MDVLGSLMDPAPLARGPHLCAAGSKPWATAASAPGAHSRLRERFRNVPCEASPLAATSLGSSVVAWHTPGDDTE